MIAQPLSLLLGAVQMTCIYVALAIKNQKTSETIDFLQEIIEKRELIEGVYCSGSLSEGCSEGCLGGFTRGLFREL